MPKAFDSRNPPFDRLTADELETLRKALDIGYFRPNETIIRQGESADSLYVVIKGVVEEHAGDEVVAHLGPNDSFDSHALMQGRSRHGFVAREETLCYLLPRPVALELIQANRRFAAYFYLDLSHRLDAMAREEEDSSVGALMRARVRDLKLSPACFIDANDTIETAGRRMSEVDCNALFVRDGDRVGVLTGMNLSKAVVLKRMTIDAPVGSLAHFDVVALSPDDFVYSALILMTKSGKRRVAVHDGTEYVGFLEDITLLGFMAGNALVLVGRIDRAASVAELAPAAREIGEQVRLLRRQGVRVDVIAEMVSDLNRRLFVRLFALTVPQVLRERSCLIVMGSEGRGEQTIRTDQDNGLILAEPADGDVLDRFRQDFTAALEGFGFAPCPGNVMVRNSLWSRPVGDMVADFQRRIALPDENAFMDVAILYDAVAVAGDSRLLTRAKAEVMAAVRGRSAFMVHFARATDAFPMPIGFFHNLTGDAVDLKKGGIFTIVHGVRSLALERGLTETSTVARIRLLVEAGRFSSDFGRELIQALHLLMTMRLDAQLASGTLSDAVVRPAALSSMQRDVLRDAFHVVKQFREIVRRHFNLGAF
jgi:CBS domain-containing protein